jgi:hypothetical protein
MPRPLTNQEADKLVEELFTSNSSQYAESFIDYKESFYNSKDYSETTERDLKNDL